jgi:hypothetical protein
MSIIFENFRLKPVARAPPFLHDVWCWFFFQDARRWVPLFCLSVRLKEETKKEEYNEFIISCF